jgi:hypothetical protein
VVNLSSRDNSDALELEAKKVDLEELQICLVEKKASFVFQKVSFLLCLTITVSTLLILRKKILHVTEYCRNSKRKRKEPNCPKTDFKRCR